MQGSSALQAVLERVDAKVAVFAVWEPVLGTDVAPPDDETLALLKDARAWQLWDADHLMSDAIREAMRQQPSSIPIARRRTGEKEDGLLWDAVAIFPPGGRWEKTLPAPAYLDGDVVDVSAAVEQTLRRLVAR